MLDLIKNLDILGRSFSLNFKRVETFKTVLGGVITILYGLMTLILIWYFGQDIYLKKKSYCDH